MIKSHGPCLDPQCYIRHRFGEMNTFDELLTILGTGKWNIYHFVFAGYFSMILAAQNLHTIYLAPSINYTCQPHPDHIIQHIANDSCSYVRQTTSGEVVEEPCTVWKYDTSVYNTTLTADYDLVCDRAYLRATYQSFYTFAALFGCLITGSLADRFGRKTVGVVTVLLLPVLGITLSLINNFQAILFLRFMIGFLATPTIYTLGLEACQVKHRSLVGTLLGLPWGVGIMLMGVTAMYIRDWRTLQLAITLPALLFLILMFLINESPRWLMVTGRHQKALEVLHRVARLNKASLPPDTILLPMMVNIQREHEQRENQDKDHRRQNPDEEVPTGAAADSIAVNSTAKSKTQTNIVRCKRCPKGPRLLSTPKLRIVVVLVGVIMFMSSLVYYGINLSGSNYSSDPFLYMILAGLMEVPAYCFSGLFIHRWGRRFPAIIGYAVTGIIILGINFIPPKLTWLVMTLALVGKIFLTSSYMIMFVYGVEMFPTEVRVQGMAISYLATQIAGSLSPYIADFLRPAVPWLPSVVFGVAAFIACGALLPLPETLNKALPDTIQDLDRLWDKNKNNKTTIQPDIYIIQTPI